MDRPEVPLDSVPTTPVPREPLRDLQAKRVEYTGNKGRGLVLLEGEFRVAVQMVPPCDCLGNLV